MTASFEPGTFAAGAALLVGVGVMTGLWLGNDRPKTKRLRNENLALWAAVRAMKELIGKHPYLSRQDLSDVGYGAALDELERIYGKAEKRTEPR